MHEAASGCQQLQGEANKKPMKLLITVVLELFFILHHVYAAAGIGPTVGPLRLSREILTIMAQMPTSIASHRVRVIDTVSTKCTSSVRLYRLAFRDPCW